MLFPAMYTPGPLRMDAAGKTGRLIGRFPLLETCTDQTARQARTAVMPLLNTGVAAQWAAELSVTRCPKVVTALQRASGIGAGAAAGAGMLFLVLHHRGHVTGCVRPADDGLCLLDEKKNESYAPVPGDV